MKAQVMDMGCQIATDSGYMKPSDDSHDYLVRQVQWKP